MVGYFFSPYFVDYVLLYKRVTKSCQLGVTSLSDYEIRKAKRMLKLLLFYFIPFVFATLFLTAFAIAFPSIPELAKLTDILYLLGVIVSTTLCIWSYRTMRKTKAVEDWMKVVVLAVVLLSVLQVVYRIWHFVT